MRAINLLLLVSLTLLASGCAPALVVRHRDPDHRNAEVWIDGSRAGSVELNGEESFDVEAGPHQVRVVPPGAEKSPWHDEEHLLLVLEDEGVLTLLPRAKP